MALAFSKTAYALVALAQRIGLRRADRPQSPVPNPPASQPLGSCRYCNEA